MAEFPKFEEMAKNVADRALDEVLYDGKSIREWMQIIVSEDCISRTDAINAMSNAIKRVFPEHRDIAEKTMNKLPPVTPQQPKMGRWVLAQRDKYIDINCSECGNTRIKEYAYNYIVDEIDMQEIKDLVVTSKMNYCECCGCKMQEE